ncbi:MAG: hypothetical protein U9O94_06285 [Nanoarchaeota archaeon]|nr:hypothetical protein [Nanoarchaeota archaeon]
MKTYKPEDDKLAFARKAAEYFANHPEHCTYRENDFKEDCFLALRWGADEDCVLVVTLSGYEGYDEPTLYPQFIDPDAPKQEWLSQDTRESLEHCIDTLEYIKEVKLSKYNQKIIGEVIRKLIIILDNK